MQKPVAEKQIEMGGQLVTVHVYAPHGPRVRVEKVSASDPLAYERIAEARAEACHLGLGALTSSYRDGDDVVLF